MVNFPDSDIKNRKMGQNKPDPKISIDTSC